MKITIIDKKDITIKTQNKTLVIEKQKVPFHLIDTLIIVGKNTLQTEDINRLTNDNIQIILLSHNFTQSSIISSTSAKSAELKLAQYNAAVTNQLSIAKTILTHKIKAHIQHLKSHDIDIDKNDTLTKIQEAKELNTLLGIEGSFSKFYFGYYFAMFPKNLHKGKRSKRPPLDPLNALLSWQYTLFYNIIATRLISYGFEPSIGFLHRPFRSHMALASDILEIYRADINQFVYELFTNKVVNLSDFSKKGGVYLRYEGRKKLYKPFREFQLSLEPRIETTITELRSML